MTLNIEPMIKYEDQLGIPTLRFDELPQHRRPIPGELMKIVVLAGGYGTRLAEETDVKPKPLVTIGNYPILWHIMMYYSHYGYEDFVLALGYRGNDIKKYMLDYCRMECDLDLEFCTGASTACTRNQPRWRIDLIDTGLDTMTGGRLKRLAPLLGKSTFMCTYGDGLANVPLDKLIAFHRSHGKLATVTAVHPPTNNSFIRINNAGAAVDIESFAENEKWINGGFFVLEPEVLDYIEGDHTQWEREPLQRLAADGQLMAFKHDGFWQCMDTLAEKESLEQMWTSGHAPWKIWE